MPDNGFSTTNALVLGLQSQEHYMLTKLQITPDMPDFPIQQSLCSCQLFLLPRSQIKTNRNKKKLSGSFISVFQHDSQSL